MEKPLGRNVRQETFQAPKIYEPKLCKKALRCKVQRRWKTETTGTCLPKTAERKLHVTFKGVFKVNRPLPI